MMILAINLHGRKPRFLPTLLRSVCICTHIHSIVESRLAFREAMTSLNTFSTQPDRYDRTGRNSKLANWAALPPELLQLVARRLYLEDYVNFAAVCTSWRSAAAKENYDPKTRPPWLMLFLSNSTKFFPFREREKGRRNSKCKPLRVYGRLEPHFSRGWLAKGRIGGKLSLFNPLSRGAIKLPSLELRRRPLPSVEQFALSANPSQTEDYNVMISFTHAATMLGQQTWVWRSGQRAWRRVRVPDVSGFLQLIHYKGQFVALAYALEGQLQILALDENDVAEGVFTVRLQLDGESFTDDYFSYLVECLGSLLLVTSWDGDEGLIFRVFEVDLEKGNYREVKSLGNASLFLNRPYFQSFSVESDNSDELGWVAETVKPNCIYFDAPTFHLEHSFNLERGLGIGMYHMDNGHIEVKTQVEWGSTKDHAWFQPCL